jgi:hypothetical protein
MKTLSKLSFTPVQAGLSQRRSANQAEVSIEHIKDTKIDISGKKDSATFAPL